MARPSDLKIVQRYAMDLPVDVPGLIHELGLSYLEQKMDPDISSVLDMSNSAPSISVNSALNQPRKRLAAAHSLGHYLFHREQVAGKEHRDMIFAPDGPAETDLADSLELEALEFAADLIIPRKLCGVQYHQHNVRIAELAEMCGVTEAAMEGRLTMLGIIEPQADTNDLEEDLEAPGP